MAHLSPSPSGSSSGRRRLSEVLQEQQEPFSLDIYLLERGCSPAFLDATACGGGGGACSTCWPKTRGTGRTLRRPVRNKKGSRRNGVLRMLLAKILSVTTAPAAATKQNHLQQRAAIRWRRVVVEKQRTTPADSFVLALRPASPGAAEAHMEDDDGEQEDNDEDDDDDVDDEDESSKKQMSPVSVLEQRLFEHSPPPPPHVPKALAIFGELLEAAYTPNTLLEDVLAIARDRSSSSTESKDCRPRSSSSTDGSSTPPPTPWARRRRRRKKKHARRKEDVAFEKDLGRVTSLVASEMAGAARVRAEDLEDVGVLVATAVLEALTEETAAELMGMDMDHRGCAAGMARWCGRCRC